MSKLPRKDASKQKSINDAIERISSIDLRHIRIDELKALINALMVGYVYTTGVFPSNRVLHRISVNYKAMNVNELKHPPSHLTRLGRANRDRSPMFYCASNDMTAINERKASLGDEFTISHWLTTNEFVVSHVGYTRLNLAKLGAIRSDKVFSNFSPIGKYSTDILEWLSSVFTQSVSSTEHYKYKLSTAISEVFLKPVINSESQIVGIVYPSVASFGKGENFAFKPTFVETGIRVAYAAHCRVKYLGIDKTDQEPFYTIEVLDETTTFSEDGSIIWKHS